MATKEELIAQAQAKFKKEQLVAAAKAKWAKENAPDNTDPAETIAQTARSAVEGVTLGASEPVFSGINALTSQLYQAAKEAKDPVEFAEKLIDLDRLGKNYDYDVHRRREFEANNPLKHQTAEMVGNIAPALMTGGESQLAKVAAAPGEMVNASGTAIKELLSKIPGVEKLLASEGVGGSVARVAQSAASGAAQAVTQEGVKRSIQKPTGFIQPQDQIPSMTDVAETGAMFAGGMQLAPELVKQGGRALKQGARILTGVKPQDIDTYLADPERIRNAKTVAEVKDMVDETVGKLRDDVENAKLTKEQAREALKEAEQKLNDHVRENKNLVAQQKADIKYAFKEASANLNIAAKEAEASIKGARLPIKPDDVMESTNIVRDKVSDLSRDSYEILGQYDGKFSLEGAAAKVKKIQDELKTGGQLLSKDSERAYNELQKWHDKLSKFDKTELNGKEVKQIIQEIDSDIREYGDKLAGNFSDKSYTALMSVRHSLDQLIKKNVPGYSEVMVETAKMNQIRQQMAKLFGRREAVVSKLARIDSPSMENEREALRTLGAVTGRDYSSPLDEYMKTKAMTKTPLAKDALKQSLPEYDAYIEAMRKNARAQRPEFGQGLLEKAQTVSQEAQGVRAAQGKLSAAEQELATARGALEPFKRVTDQNSENIIRTLMGDKTRKIELKKMMQNLGQVSDQDFVRIIADMRVRDTFEKGFVNGSSNVNLWAILSGAFGAIMGDPTLGAASATAGAGFGKFMDAYGPKLTRRVLDGMIYMRGVPTIQKINSTFADLPEPVREKLKSDLVRLVTVGNSTGQVVVPPDQRFDIAKDIKDAKNMDTIEKANAITEMNKTGAVSSKIMQDLMIGNEKPQVEEAERPIQQQAAPQRYELKNVSDFIKNKKPEAY